MYCFLNDYSESAYPDILNALQDSHLVQYSGYGSDEYSQQVRDMIRRKISKNSSTNDPSQQDDQIAVHFAITGTQANMVCIAAMLSPIDGIIACDTGHIAVNEAGAIEATGHKVILTDAIEGKLTVDSVDSIKKRHEFKPHVVRAKAIYISNATELGTVYTRQELKALYDYCHANDMYVFMDGARLGAALASSHQDMTLADICQYTDMFWLGGTKMGAMFGEIIIISNPNIAKDFDIHLKQRGGLLAKGYLTALQFSILLQEDKYLDLCNHANAMADKLAQAIVQYNSEHLSQLTHQTQQMQQTYLHCELTVPTQSNQVFTILPNALIKHLKTQFDFYEWQSLPNDRSMVRLVTSWATPEDKIDEFIAMLQDFYS